MTLNEESPLTTERVATGRRGPVAVAIVAIVVVGLFLWKPWDRPIAALPGPTDGPVLSFRPRPTPTARASEPVATPELPPTFNPGQVVIDTDVGEIFDPGYAIYECAAQDVSDTRELADIALGGPTVQLLFGDPAVRFLSWHAEINANHIDKVFEADWQPVLVSDPQMRRVHDLDLVSFDQATIKWDLPADPLMVIQPVFVLEWQGRGHVPIGAVSFTPRTFALDPAGFRLADGCDVRS